MLSKALSGTLALLFTLAIATLPNDSLAQSDSKRSSSNALKVKNSRASTVKPSKQKRDKSEKRSGRTKGKSVTNKGKGTVVSTGSSQTVLVTNEPAARISAATTPSTVPNLPDTSSNSAIMSSIDFQITDGEQTRVDDQTADFANFWDIIRPNSYKASHLWCLSGWNVCRINTLEQPTEELQDYYISLTEELKTAIETEQARERDLAGILAGISYTNPRDRTDPLTDLCILVGDAASCLLDLPRGLDDLWKCERELREIRMKITALKEELKKLVEVLDELPEKGLGECLLAFRWCEYEAWKAEEEESKQPPKDVPGAGAK